MYYSAPPTLMHDLAYAEDRTRSGPGSQRAHVADSGWPTLPRINMFTSAAAPEGGWLRSLRCWASQATAIVLARAKATADTAGCASP
jgi:hypothetical protein